MKKINSLLFSLLLCIALVIISVFLMIQMYQEASAKETAPLQIHLHEAKQTVSLSKTVIETVTIGGIGDILIHDWVYNDAKAAAGYNFKPMFEQVKPLLQQPDVLLANQETILGGKTFGISSYPLFNSPQEVGDALIDAGVDIVSTANNHSLDKGEKGQIASLNYMDQIGLSHVGTYRSHEDKQKLKVITKNGIKIGFLSYTYGTNGIPVPEGKEYLVNLIDKEAIKQEIYRAKGVADVLIMSIHWGNEYQRYPVEAQIELAQFLADEGIDVIFGHHPHVLQPMSWIKAKDGRDVFVVYSLGNFLSGQYHDYKDIGGMATVEITKEVYDGGKKITINNPQFYPTYVSNKGLKQYRIVPLQNAASYGLKNAENKYKEIQQHMLGGLK